MRLMLRSVLVFFVPLQIWASDLPPDATPPREFGASIDKLAVALDRLAGLVEKDLAIRADEREARRVEVAVGIMGLRYRKIDRLEAEIQQSNHEEEEIARHLGLMKAEADQLDKQGRTESGELTQAAKNEIAMLDLRIKSQQDRSARLRERALELQNDVTAERRRLANVEAVLDAWMEKQ